ncbi:MAG: Rrf2 family transcriptional regulator [FCB group bacterium]|nr:Rrf2 family transcriptional regulator [FCB group bacterium]
MIFSKACIHGLVAVMSVASKSPDRPYIPIGELSRELHISFHFLTKVLQILTRKAILKSYRGPNGGIALARPSRDIHLIEVVEAIDGKGLFETCILGLSGCGTETPCPLHDHWAQVRELLQQSLEEITLASIEDQLRCLDLRISDPD